MLHIEAIAHVSLQRSVAQRVSAETRDEADPASRACRCNRLVRALTARSAEEFAAEQGLTGSR
jgi:hypothetical protein